MKRLAPLFIVFLFASCEPFGFNPEGYEVLNEPLEVAWPKSAALKYIPDGAINYWQSPNETIARGGGDCEDIAIYLMYLLGKESSLVMICEGNYNHAIVGYRGAYLEAQIIGQYYSLQDIDIIKTRDYGYTMAKATKFGTLSIKN